MAKQVKFGVDVLLETGNFKDAAIGLVCNAASLTNNGIHSRIALLENGFNIKKLFAPEHGFNTKGDDGKFIMHEIDNITGLPIISLYSEKLAPTTEDLQDIDLVIVDLPDIGARFYTYLWTMTHVMEACEKNNRPLLILDRVNPIATDFEYAEGPMLDENCSSFIGRFPIPIKHNCTIAELANYFKHLYYPSLKLEMITMQNWDRTTNNNYIFYPTSPAIQNRKTAYFYPGSCLFEGVNINEARGTEFPFEQFGAPWIDATKLKNEILKSLDIATLEVVNYKAVIQPYENETCYGLRVIPKELTTFKPVAYFAEVIRIIANLFPDHLKERNYLTNANPNGEQHFDKIVGIPNAFNKIIAGNLIIAVPNWHKTIAPYLLYT